MSGEEDLDTHLYAAFEDLDRTLKKSSTFQNNLSGTDPQEQNPDINKALIQQTPSVQKSQKQKASFDPLGRKTKQSSNKHKDIVQNSAKSQQILNEVQRQQQQSQESRNDSQDDQLLIENELNTLLENLTTDDEEALQNLIKQISQVSDPNQQSDKTLNSHDSNRVADLFADTINNKSQDSTSSTQLQSKSQGNEFQDALKNLALSRGENLEQQQQKQQGQGSQKQAPDSEDKLVGDILQFLISKEVLYQPMKDISDRYPEWLEQNQNKIDQKEYSQYQKQHELLQQVIQIYDTQPNNYSLILERIQEMKESGQPPKDILDNLDPGSDQLFSKDTGEDKLGQMFSNLFKV